MPISDEALLDYNRQGFIPGPGEEEEAFEQRVNYCLHLERARITPLEQAHQVPSTDKKTYYKEAFSVTEPLFDIAPEWVPLFFSDHQLTPWHGGCAWIFQETESSPLTAILQIRKILSRKATYLKIYKREELIAHELAHVGRMLFEEPRFEELLAYRTSSSPFRRWFGPIVQSMSESVAFLLIALLIFMIDGFLLYSEAFDIYQQAMWLKSIPLVLVGYALWRLWRKQRCYKNCLSQLGKLVGTAKASSVAYRLTDEEILYFATHAPSDIHNYVQQQKQLSLRWRLIALAYF